MTILSGIAGYNPYAIRQNLFNMIDANGDGSVTKTEVENAVTAAGSNTQAADALYAQLDPSNTGNVTQQEFNQNLPGPPLSDSMGTQLIVYQAQGWPGTSGGDPASVLGQNLFSQIDADGDGSITKSELEQAVTKAGGTAQAADALYAQLDPNNAGSVSQQQFTDALSQMLPHHHHGHRGKPGDSNGAENAPPFDAQGAGVNAATPPWQLAQNLFSQIDTDASGSVSKSELEQAVTAAGGTSQAADALYAQLDPNNTGSVSEQQFAQALQPPSPSGTTAEDALLALLDPSFQNTSPAPAVGGGDGSTDATSTSASGGNTAQDALLALLNASGMGSATGANAAGNTAQDAMLALLNGSLGINGSGASTQDPLLSPFDGGSSFIFDSAGTSARDALLALLQSSAGASSGGPAGSSATEGPNGINLAAALALYQGQLNQQVTGALGGGSMNA